MDLSPGDIEAISEINYDGEQVQEIQEIFRRLYSPTREIAREYPQIHEVNQEDLYRTGNLGAGRIDDLEELQQEELEKNITVEVSLEGPGSDVVYEVTQINENNKRYTANAPCSVLLESDRADDFVLHEAKSYRESQDAYHHDAGKVEDFLQTGTHGHISIQEFFEGIKGVYSTLESTQGLTPLVPEVGIVQDLGEDGYDELAEQQTYYVRSFDEQLATTENLPAVEELAELAVTRDVLGVARDDAEYQEILRSREGFAYEADLEKLSLVSQLPTEQDSRNPGLLFVKSIFDRKCDFEMDGCRPWPSEVKDAIEDEYKPEDFDVEEIRAEFRESISEWNPDDLTGPFIDLT